MVGSGECLLNRKVRGVVGGSIGPDEVIMNDFDFETNLAEFNKVNITETVPVSTDEGKVIELGEGNNIGDTLVYHKNEFFDSISCDVLDKQNGIDNRLRGSDERSLNTETFGAVSLGNKRRGGRKNKRGYGGRGRGGRYAASGVTRYNDGTRPRENNRWLRESGEISGSSNTTTCNIDNKGLPMSRNTWTSCKQ